MKMKKPVLLGAAAVVSTVLATPLMAQEATQEPGAIGFNYPNSRYLTGGYGVRTPYNTGRYPHMFPAARVVAYGPVADVAIGPVGVTVGSPAAIATAPYDSYAYYGADW
jgi:hypothetical protein